MITRRLLVFQCHLAWTSQVRLGHADISVTMNIYAHSTQAMNERAAQKIDEMIFGEAVND